MLLCVTVRPEGSWPNSRLLRVRPDGSETPARQTEGFRSVWYRVWSELIVPLVLCRTSPQNMPVSGSLLSLSRVRCS